ncbi:MULTISPECIES: TadE/TadG family type IV pilus assembly protein [unclassified Methylobacterium]|uniref:TadE/TadG family type IV pilus assembly protein n=1 Tax=unclassified Methylobacterium TaxID=2615210 RepID=UPI0016505390|nr:TadE/TadG family type IV pilus assembly protein [Methylobacterium sp. WL64]
MSNEFAPPGRTNEILLDESGAALIEAALILPVLLLLILGAADISLYLWNAELAAKAVQLGLRKAIVSDAIASGPGLDRAESETYWNGLPPGLRCAPADHGPCPSFAVTCTLAGPCSCRGDACRFSPAPSRAGPILAAMRAILPGISTRNVEVTYRTNGLGYVGRPVPVPVDVTLRLVGYEYSPVFLGGLLGAALPLRASATLPSEDLTSQ